MKLKNGIQFDVRSGDQQELVDTYLNEVLAREIRDGVSKQMDAWGISGTNKVQIVRVPVSDLIRYTPRTAVPSYASVHEVLEKYTEISIDAQVPDDGQDGFIKDIS